MSVQRLSKTRRAKLMNEASRKANAAADALRYLDSAVSAAGEAGVFEPMTKMRADLEEILELSASSAGFAAKDFYSNE